MQEGAERGFEGVGEGDAVRVVFWRHAFAVQVEDRVLQLLQRLAVVRLRRLEALPNYWSAAPAGFLTLWESRSSARSFFILKC